MLAGGTLVYEALAVMRATRQHLVLVDTEAGRTVVTMTDLVERLLPSAA